MSSSTRIVVDFDSTFIQVEALEELAAISLAGRSDQKTLLSEIASLTERGMDGSLAFEDALQQRLALLHAHRTHIDATVAVLQQKVSASVVRNRQFFRDNAARIWIVSGGFHELIWPIVQPFGITRDHILANSFVYDFDGNVVGCDPHSPLSRNQGKVTAVRALNGRDEVVVVGDGITDYEIREAGAAQKFFVSVENVRRPAVMGKADHVIESFDEFLTLQGEKVLQNRSAPVLQVLLLENIHPLAVESMKAQGLRVDALPVALDEDDLCRRIAGVNVLGIRSKTSVTQKVLEAAEDLLAIGSFCIGTNKVDLEACARRGIPVFNAPYGNTRSVVELAIGEAIMLLRRVWDKSTKMHAGTWDKTRAGAVEVRGKRLGIVGYGNIGSQLSVVAESLGMQVSYYDVDEKLPLGNAKKCETLKELMKQSDVVSVHVDGRAGNRNMLDAEELECLPHGAVVINLSRGEVVNLEALGEALRSGKVSGAAVDVYPVEPKGSVDTFDHPLQNTPNVILTPHVGGNTDEAQCKIADFVSERLVGYCKKGNTSKSVNFPNLQLPALQKTHRLVHIHENIPGMIAQISGILAKHAINIEGQYLKTNEWIGYVITDISAVYDQKLLQDLESIPGTIRLRVLY